MRRDVRHYSSGYITLTDYVMMYMRKWKRAAVVLLVLWIVVTFMVIWDSSARYSKVKLADVQDKLNLVTSQLDTLRHQHSNLIARIRKSAGDRNRVLITMSLNTATLLLSIEEFRCLPSSPSSDQFAVTIMLYCQRRSAMHQRIVAKEKLKNRFSNLKDMDGSLFLDSGQGPTQEYENLRRRIYSNTKELWYYVNHELSKLKNDEDRIKAILEQVADRKRSLLSDQEMLPELDGHQDWRHIEAANVSDLIQRRLHYLQNPSDCKEARKLVCNLNKGCGFGCQLHHITYCLIFAYATERTLILNSKGWRYNTKGWEYVFHPISDTCTSVYNDKVQQWPGSFDAKVVSLPFIDSIWQKPKFLPLAVPKDLAHRIIRFNGDPSSWWVGQVLKYILKPRAAMQKAINDTISKMNFKKPTSDLPYPWPIVGVHIRRTDKVGTEAAFHHIQEYMIHVKDYFDRLKLTKNIDVRRVYLATDDASVLEDARKKYPEYTFLGDPSIAKTAATHRRYTPLSLTGLLVDLHMLSMCDYIVCTFSSQVGRVAYEMMQTNRMDASDSFFSLDDIYYFGGQNAHDRRAVMWNEGSSHDIALKVDDLIGIAGNHWNGYGRGTNRRTNINGLVPWYKTVDHLVLYPFPEYKEVPLYSDTRQGDL